MKLDLVFYILLSLLASIEGICQDTLDNFQVEDFAYYDLGLDIDHLKLFGNKNFNQELISKIKSNSIPELSIYKVSSRLGLKSEKGLNFRFEEHKLPPPKFILEKREVLLNNIQAKDCKTFKKDQYLKVVVQNFVKTIFNNLVYSSDSFYLDKSINLIEMKPSYCSCIEEEFDMFHLYYDDKLNFQGRYIEFFSSRSDFGARVNRSHLNRNICLDNIYVSENELILTPINYTLGRKGQSDFQLLDSLGWIYDKYVKQKAVIDKLTYKLFWFAMNAPSYSSSSSIGFRAYGGKIVEEFMSVRSEPQKPFYILDNTRYNWSFLNRLIMPFVVYKADEQLENGERHGIKYGYEYLTSTYLKHNRLSSIFANHDTYKYFGFFFYDFSFSNEPYYYGGLSQLMRDTLTRTHHNFHFNNFYADDGELKSTDFTFGFTKQNLVYKRDYIKFGRDTLLLVGYKYGVEKDTLVSERLMNGIVLPIKDNGECSISIDTFYYDSIYSKLMYEKVVHNNNREFKERLATSEDNERINKVLYDCLNKLQQKKINLIDLEYFQLIVKTSSNEFEINKFLVYRYDELFNNPHKKELRIQWESTDKLLLKLQ